MVPKYGLVLSAEHALHILQNKAPDKISENFFSSFLGFSLSSFFYSLILFFFLFRVTQSFLYRCKVTIDPGSVEFDEQNEIKPTNSPWKPWICVHVAVKFLHFWILARVNAASWGVSMELRARCFQRHITHLNDTALAQTLSSACCVEVQQRAHRLFRSLTWIWT
jgi:hypothetical protein